MTVLKLTMTLLWKMLTFQVKPNTLVVREFSYDYDKNEPYYKNVVFVDTGLTLPEYPCRLCKNDPCLCDGIHHRMFGRHGDGPARDLIRLD